MRPDPEAMRILLNTWEPFVLSHVKDFGIARDFTHLSQRFPDLEFVTVTSLPLVAAANLKYLVQRGIRRLPTRHLVRPWQRYWKRFERLSLLTPVYIRKAGADVVVSHGSVPWPLDAGNVARVLFSNLESRLFYERAGLLEQLPLEIEVKRWTLRDADVVVTAKPESARRLEERIPELRGKVWFIPIYDPSVEALDEGSVREKHDTTETLRVVFAGGQARRKGLPQLLQAWEMLEPSIRSRLELTVVSSMTDGDVRPVPADVHLIRSLAHGELVRLFGASHVLVFPTWYDNFGRVISEAMAQGCCVITSHQEPQDWIVDYGRAGLLVDPSSPASIARALTSAANDKGMRRRLALCARERFVRLFHHHIVGQQYHDVFLAALAHRREMASAAPSG